MKDVAEDFAHLITSLPILKAANFRDCLYGSESKQRFLIEIPS